MGEAAGADGVAAALKEGAALREAEVEPLPQGEARAVVDGSAAVRVGAPPEAVAGGGDNDAKADPKPDNVAHNVPLAEPHVLRVATPPPLPVARLLTVGGAVKAAAPVPLLQGLESPLLLAQLLALPQGLPLALTLLLEVGEKEAVGGGELEPAANDADALPPPEGVRLTVAVAATFENEERRVIKAAPLELPPTEAVALPQPLSLLAAVGKAVEVGESDPRPPPPPPLLPDPVGVPRKLPLPRPPPPL